MFYIYICRRLESIRTVAASFHCYSALMEGAGLMTRSIKDRSDHGTSRVPAILLFIQILILTLCLCIFSTIVCNYQQKQEIVLIIRCCGADTDLDVRVRCTYTFN